MSATGGRLTIGIELIDDPAWMGGTLYLRNLASCLLRLPPGERPTVRLLGAAETVARFWSESGAERDETTGQPGIWRRVLRRAGIGSSANDAIDVVYPGFGAAVAGAVTMRWIPDFQHRYLPDLFSAEEREARDRSIGAIAAQDGVVVFSSAVAAGDFGRFYPDARATARVWHFCSLIDTRAAPAPLPVALAPGLPKKYLYLPNQFWAHKNHITVFKALARVRAEHGLVIPLVCTGAQSDRRNADHFGGLMRFIEEHDLAGQIQLLGLIDRADQLGILRRAAAIVQPSRFEGWSTVVEDVRATGRPIFLSDLPVHREQAPQHCAYFPPESDAALAELLHRQWAELEAGPDAKAEAAARAQLESRIADSARKFCDIARTAVRIARR